MNNDGHSDDFLLKKKVRKVPKYPTGRVKNRKGEGDLNVFQSYSLSEKQRDRVNSETRRLGEQ